MSTELKIPPNINQKADDFLTWAAKSSKSPGASVYADYLRAAVYAQLWLEEAKRYSLGWDLDISRSNKASIQFERWSAEMRRLSK